MKERLHKMQEGRMTLPRDMSELKTFEEETKRTTLNRIDDLIEVANKQGVTCNELRECCRQAKRLARILRP